MCVFIGRVRVGRFGRVHTHTRWVDVHVMYVTQLGCKVKLAELSGSYMQQVVFANSRASVRVSAIRNVRAFRLRINCEWNVDFITVAYRPITSFCWPERASADRRRQPNEFGLGRKQTSQTIRIRLRRRRWLVCFDFFSCVVLIEVVDVLCRRIGQLRGHCMQINANWPVQIDAICRVCAGWRSDYADNTHTLGHASPVLQWSVLPYMFFVIDMWQKTYTVIQESRDSICCDGEHDFVQLALFYNMYSMLC